MSYLLQELNYLAQKVDQLEKRLETVEQDSEKLKKAEQVAEYLFHGVSGKRGKPPTKP